MKPLLLRQLLLGCCIILTMFIIHTTGLTSYLSLTWLEKNVHYLQLLVHEHYWRIVTLYIFSYICVSCCAIPGTTFFIIVSGLLFGLIPGILFALIGVVSGATLLFLISRYIIGSWIQHYYEDKFIIINQAIARDGHFYMLLGRILTIFPFGMLTIIAGITLLPVQTFIWTTAVGMSPYIVLYVFAGQQLSCIQSTDTFCSMPMLIFVSTIALRISLIPLVMRYIITIQREGF